MSAAAVPDTRIDSYRRIQIYGTKSRLYVVGHDSGVCRILKFRRQDGPRLDAVVDPICYTPSQLSLVLRKVHEQSGGLQLICKVGLGVLQSVGGAHLHPHASISPGNSVSIFARHETLNLNALLAALKAPLRHALQQ